jgi:hypothetical protein
MALIKMCLIIIVKFYQASRGLKGKKNIFDADCKFCQYGINLS